MDSKTLREKFIKSFENKGHKLLPPASLVPEDQSVLFTTAGMQQFKKFYTNPSDAPAKNAVTVQPCFRTSDIEEVGDDTHLTFFEMLGNFAFNDYFKKEAIEMGYDFLVKELEVEPKRIYCSVFKGDSINPRDDESVKILEDMGLTYKEHSREDNFWGPTGEEGPCGPTVEFYVDNIEVWNLVFNEYYKEKSGKYHNLETKGVDTGMGLERMLVVANSFHDVYETDLFKLLIQEIAKISNKKYTDCENDFRIIADHIKATVFAINDNILPSNKDRGYVVRRLIRRAIIKGHQLEINENFTAKLTDIVFKTYDSIYTFDQEKIITELEKEEIKFRETLRQGLKEFEKQKQNLTGEIAFNLYQTYGFPWEMTAELAKENNIEVSLEDFENAFKKHQELSRTASAGMFKGGLSGGGQMETKYHTATHLLLASLRQILGNDIYQKGSNITAERLRFDFNYQEKLTDEQLKKVQDLVNENISDNIPVETKEMSKEEALKIIKSSFDQSKYGDIVKVYSIDNFSVEICGGPHVKSTGELSYFKIIKEESSSAGIRRIKAVLE